MCMSICVGSSGVRGMCSAVYGPVRRVRMSGDHIQCCGWSSGTRVRVWRTTCCAINGYYDRGEWG